MKNINTLLVERGVASMRQVEEAMAKQVLYGGDLASYVLEKIGQEREGELLAALGEHFGLPAAAPGPLPAATPQALQAAPRELLQRHGFFPLTLGADAFEVAVSTPLPDDVEGDLFFVLRVPTRQVVACRVRVRQALARDLSLALDEREQRMLAKIEGRPVPNPSTVPPPNPEATSLPSLRSMRLPAVPAADEPIDEMASTVHPAPRAPQEGRNPAWPQATRGLLRWMQRASQSTPAQRRKRRGPMSVGECEELLSEAPTAEEALQTFFDFARQYFNYSALFLVQGDLAEGRDAFGPGAERERVAGVGISLDLPSCLAHARNRGAPVCMPLRHDGLDAGLASDLRRSPKGSVLVVPVLVRQRCVALLYADDGESSIELSDAAEVIGVASLAGNALERLAVRKRKRPAEPAEASTPASAAPRRKATLAGMAPVQPPLAVQAAQGRQQKAIMLARALGIPGDLPRATAPPPTLSSPSSGPEDSNPFRRITASFQITGRRDDEEPIPDTILAERPEAAQGKAPRAEDSEMVKAALSEMLHARSSSPPVVPPVSPTLGNISAYAPPTRPPSGQESTQLPSIIVDLDDSQMHLVDRLLSSPDDDDALSEILREGVTMVPALLSRQPGPLRLSIEALVAGEGRPSQAGPLLRALVAMRRTALPFVVAQSGSKNTDQRLLATLLLGEFPYAEAAQGLIPRFFDADPQVARAAVLSGRLLRSTPGVFEVIQHELSRLAAVEAGERKEKAVRAVSELVRLPKSGGLSTPGGGRNLDAGRGP